MNRSIIQLLLCVCFCHSFYAQGQYAIGDLDLDGNVTEWYDKTNPIKDLELFEGSIFNITTLSSISHQFFGARTWSSGTITYDGQSYKNIDMLYDLQLDVLLVRNASAVGNYKQAILVVQDKIENFSFKGALFKNIKVNAPPSGSGIYHILFNGDHVNLVVKRIKLYRMEAALHTSRGIYFYHFDKYYFTYVGSYVAIKNKRNVIKTFKEFKDEIKGFIKSEQLKIKRGNDDDIKALLTYCDGLVTRG